MSRAKWKGPNISPEKLKIKNLKKQLNFKLPRNIEITPKFVGLIFNIHNGKEYQEITVTDEMIGRKFGEFVFTRKKFSFKKKNNFEWVKKQIPILFD